jgi:hypothetical protein
MGGGLFLAAAREGGYNSAMFSARRIVFCGFLAATACASAGCVERRITIGSDPSGALVMLNDQEVGRTPISVPFTWYGDYDVRLTYEKNVGTPEKPVMERYYLHTHRRTKAPAFEWIGVDLFAQLLPVHLQDDQVWAFEVPKLVEPSDAELLQNAQELKARLSEPEPLQPKPAAPKAPAK